MLAVVTQVPDESNVTGCESEGANGSELSDNLT
jgi:hypothetical protein